MVWRKTCRKDYLNSYIHSWQEIGAYLLISRLLNGFMTFYPLNHTEFLSCISGHCSLCYHSCGKLPWKWDAKILPLSCGRLRSSKEQLPVVTKVSPGVFDHLSRVAYGCRPDSSRRSSSNSAQLSQIKLLELPVRYECGNHDCLA